MVALLTVSSPLLFARAYETQNTEKKKTTWISGKDENRGGKKGSQSAPRKRKTSINGLRNLNSSMLAKKFRIGNRNRIEQILKKGRIFRQRLLSLRYLLSGKANSRFSVIVSKKLSRKAVERNRVKRRVYEAIHRNFPASDKKCYDIVVLVSPGALKTPYETLEKEILFCMQNI